jgi:small subunit ribosomal protein S8
MVLNDPISNAMNTLKTAENAGKRQCNVKPASKLLGNMLKVMQKDGFIGEFEFVDDGKSGKYKIKLNGRINNCNSITPRLEVKRNEYEEYEKRFLPAEGFGILIVSTPHGVMNQKEAIKRRTGGLLIAFVY